MRQRCKAILWLGKLPYGKSRTRFADYDFCIMFRILCLTNSDRMSIVYVVVITTTKERKWK